MRRRQPCCGWWVLLAFSLIAIAEMTSAAPPDLSSPISPFGVGSCYINNRSVQDNERWIPHMAAIGLTSYRTPHCDWGSLEVKPGEWSWTNLDAQLDFLDEQGFTYGCLVIGNPDWNEADPRGHLPVNNIEGWSNYVTQLARHVRGRTKRLEIWNEPPNFTGKDQTPADYAKLVVAAYDAAKAVDPSFEIGLAAKSAHVNYLKQVIDAGAKDHFDYVVLHPYEILDGIVEGRGSEALLMNVVPTMRKMLADRNPAKQHVPVMYSELGVSADKGDDKQASGLVKAYALSIAGGVECLEWFEGRDGDSGPMGLIDGDGNPRPAYHALGRMIELLGQRPTYLGWVELAKDDVALVFQGSNGPVMIEWSRSSRPKRVAFQSEVQVIDSLSGSKQKTRVVELSTIPQFVLQVPDHLLSRARANRDKPLDWGGDFATAEEVSIEFGDDIVEHGLHTRSGTELGEAVVADGGSARAGSVPGGNVFIVDPQFLCYDKVPIEITAEVRRNQANDNAGFKLVYESPEGFKTAGHWYTIPDNKEWHTVRWRIDDPEFVNYWGYNFVLESDGNEYNQYLIRRVSVRKLP